METLSGNISDAASLLQEIIKQEKIDVPVLPETAQRVIALIQDPESDAAQLATIIQSDPTMGGHVMRIANSAAYTPNANLVSIQQAIARLGMIEISNIAFSASLNGKMFHAPAYEKHITAIWEHALASALWSKETARVRRSNVEAAFLCGLLHTIGKPVILQTLADLAPEVGEINDDDLESFYETFEADYSRSVANAWGLPSIVAEAISFYKNFTQAPTEPELTATVAFGHQLANFTLYPEQTDKTVILDSPALELINLYPDEIEKLIENEPQIKSAMSSMSS